MYNNKGCNYPCSSRTRTPSGDNNHSDRKDNEEEEVVGEDNGDDGKVGGKGDIRSCRILQENWDMDAYVPSHFEAETY